MSRAVEQYWARQGGDLYLGSKESGGGCYLDRRHLTEHGHFLGRTGSGKTRMLQHTAGELADHGDAGILVLDPYGGLAHYLKSYCYRQGLPQRLITLDPSDALTHGILTGFNPLVRAASPQAAAAACTLALKSALGDTGDLAATPRLGKWSFASFLGLQRGQLTMGDAKHVVSFGDPTYRTIFAEQLMDTDPATARLWAWMVDLEAKNPQRAAQVFEEQLGSLSNRLALYTQIPQIAAMLQTRRFAVDALRAIQSKSVVIANLSRFTPGGLELFTEHEQKLLGTQILHTFLAAALSRNPKDRSPLFVIVDEFHRFLCPEVEMILSGGRQFGIHLLLAHQYLTQLQDIARNDWRYYQAVIGMPKVRVVFGEGGTVDADTMAREIFHTQVDPMRVKQEIYRTIQIQRVREVTAHHHSSVSGGGDMNASGSGSGSDSGATYRGGDEPGLWDDAPEPMVESFRSAMHDFSVSGSNSFYAEMGGTTTGLAVHPDPPSKELQSREFWTPDEQLFQYAQQILRQPRQHGLLAVRGEDPVFFRVADVPDPEHDVESILPLDRERLEEATRATLPHAGHVEDIAEEARARDAEFRKLASPSRSKPQVRKDVEEAKANLRASRKKRAEQ